MISIGECTGVRGLRSANGVNSTMNTYLAPTPVINPADLVRRIRRANAHEKVNRPARGRAGSAQSAPDAFTDGRGLRGGRSSVVISE